jgi:hypothetical protein
MEESTNEASGQLNASQDRHYVAEDSGSSTTYKRIEKTVDCIRPAGISSGRDMSSVDAKGAYSLFFIRCHKA